MSEHSIIYDIHTHIDRDTDIITLAEGWRDAAKDQSRSIINLKEDAIRKALIAMGWTPPAKWRKEPDAVGFWWWRKNPYSEPVVKQVRESAARKFDPPVEYLYIAEDSRGRVMSTHAGSYAAHEWHDPFIGEWSGPILPPEGGAA